MQIEPSVQNIFGENLYAILVAEIRDFAIFLLDREGVIVSWNEGARLLFGYEKNEILGQKVDFLFVPEDRQNGVVEQELHKARTEGRAEDVRWHLRKDGSHVWANGVNTALKSESGELRGFAKVARDDTLRQKSEAEREELLQHLEFERRRLAGIFQSAPAFVAVLRGENHTFELANPAYYQLVGHRDIIGKPLLEALPEIEGQGFVEILDGVLHSGVPYEGREMMASLQREPNGPIEERFVDLLYQPLLEADGTISGVFSHGVDITEQVRARRGAEEANRVKDEFLATLSHELRTPLTAIIGWTSILQSGQASPQEVARGLDTIERNARAQAQLVEDILDVSRVVTGKLRLEMQPVDLVSIIEEAVDTILPAAQAKNIRLQRVLDAGANLISGDPTRLQQIVWNLLSNALKFTPKDGRVQIRLERVDSHLEVTVSDSGVGIALEVLPHVFERFRQADSTSTRSHGGLGLGLAIVRHLVELHGGSVEAHSEGVGKGAIFTLKLPLSAVRLLDVSKSDESENNEEKVPFLDGIQSLVENSPRLDGLHVLVVDDQKDTRIFLAVVLEKCGARVTAVESAAQAFAALQTLRPDVLLSDVGMPEEDGFSLIRRVRALSFEQGGKTPAAALTAFAHVEDRVRVLRSGFQIHLPKPIDPLELATVVAALAGRSNAA
ncbi:PAS/PAC sensor hybrid histidine kinase [Abditibacterium utsteinense]|uniref:histidine kinase n=1 Tax=Abditibacterium utsteinense TaxID=1960156 RepID=A0A2S8SRC4_9BACT|nr:ATP-binding protein [Abditibacterium utsteinense]PQV63328.1 PAS/PAC sensor hybrid histidine kinase [Abditibacterium utsteinense]